MNNIKPQNGFGLGLMSAMARRAKGDKICAAILSCSSGDGASTVIARLATSAIAGGRKIALLDFNFAHPSPSLLSDMKPRDIASLIRQESDEIILCPGEGVYWAAPIKGDDSLATRINIRQIKSLLARFHENFEMVIIDGPALLNSNLGEIIALAADQTYLVVRQESTTHHEVHHAIERLQNIGVEPAGLIYNDRSLPIPDALYKILFTRRQMAPKTLSGLK